MNVVETADLTRLIGENNYRRYYPVALGLTLVAVVALAIYVNVVLGINVIYSHLFYIPIILAGIWYHRKAIYVALFLGLLHIVLSYLPGGVLTYESLIRAVIFLITAYLVGTIAARKDLLFANLQTSEDNLRQMRDTLEQQVRDRTRELRESNESLKNEIAERNRAENSLMLARFSIDRAADYIAWIAPDGSLRYVNDALCGATGYDRATLLAMKVWEIEPEYPGELWAEAWADLTRSGSSHAESTLRTCDGQTIPVAIVNNYIRFHGDEYNCTYIRDITKRKQAENALKKSRAILARAQGIAHVGNWAWDLKTGRMSWSDEVYRIFGDEPGARTPSVDALLGSVYPDDGAIVAQAFDRAVREDRLFNIDFRIVARGGEVRYVNSVADKLARDKAGRPAWIYGIIQDITKRKHVEEALLDAKDEAELYLDLMSHDINNLNQIGIGYLEMALDRPDLGGETRALVAKPLEALESSTRLIRNVSKLQRVRSGEFRMKKVNVDAIIRDLLSRCSVAGREISVNYRGCDCYVMANELLTDVFSNIIGNAIKHSQGQLAIDIALRQVTEEGRAYCLASVEDNGPGIPDSMKPRLFVRFQRGTAKTSGRGLGLYLVKTLVDNYHGLVWVEDRVPGDYAKGAKFVVKLPATEP